MAEADKRSERIVTVIETVHLTLSIHEAEALRAVLDSIAGSTVDSPRKHTDAVANALGKAGVRTGTVGVRTPPWTLAGAERDRRHAAELVDGRYVGTGLKFSAYPSVWTADDRG